MSAKVLARFNRIRSRLAVGLTVSASSAALLFVILSVVSCASTPKSERLSPQTMSSAPPPEASETDGLGPDPRELPPEPEAKAEETQSPLMVVIEDKESQRIDKPSLVEAAAAERKRREVAGKSTTVITDKNLKDFSNGQLTEAGGTPARKVEAKPEAATVSEAASTSENIDSPDPETYWRARVLHARMNWAAAVEESRHLRDRIAELRQRFYAEEDPYYRDSAIKPSWDRALDRLEETRAAIDEHRLEVRNVLEEGRRASALPGWLREGIEFEPDTLGGSRETGPSPPTEYKPGEPKVAPDPDGPRR